ncbi:gliding motility-associated C-terminal domain-containing protein [Marinirhabdus gelatinilytica]|uniref:Gliding motility-associated-like protein n=1 Tax=Marinirhabdus gelatinilytica TaxID=1703343 RepID=A0A370QIQ5_9FLAO|nr:gliding motility-associated C-terminal domain-containing protein [Marinirhabdus gelatinilytica]RDK88238.1 gliding motility-associated-like protein [Marinirhabdus gelatinilytica]
MDIKLPSVTFPTYHILPKKTCLFVAIASLLLTGVVSAQGPGNPFVDAGPDQTIDCASGGCTDITATFLDIGETDTYNVSSIPYNPPFAFDGLANSLNPDFDDRWSIVEDLPFDLCYFTNTETQFQVGSNGVVRFEVDPGDISNGWSFSEDLPNNTNATLAEANVFTPGHDIDPSVSSTEEIGYEVIGTAPNRVLVVAYFEVPMFSGSCNSLLATQMVVFYETTNVIDIYIQDKPSCPSWNSGNAALGIQNNDGDLAFVPPGRNTSDSPWTATNEAWRFTPAGDSVIEFSWLDADGNTIGTTPTLNVCPTDPVTTYTAQVIYTNCNGDTVTVTDDVEVTLDGTTDLEVDLGEDLTFCDTPSYEIVPEITGDPTGATYLWTPNGETTPTITVSTTDTYGVTVTKDGCSVSDEVDITFLTAPCDIEPLCGMTDFSEDFGTGTGRECIDPAVATTTYTCNLGGQIEDGEYVLTNISDGLNTGWHTGMEDHTPGDVDGRAFFVNADFTVGEFYRRTITLDADTNYSFGAWITTMYDTDTTICGGNSIPSNVIFRIEDPTGTMIAETNTGDIPNGPEPNWQQFFINFNTGNNTDIQLVLINNSIGGCGNDLALDDITLELATDIPVIVTPDDLSVCDENNDGVEVFDLTVQIPTILDGQDPADFNITFHNTLLDAEAGQLAIDDPTAYSNTVNPETIYVRVERVEQETCFSTVAFDLILNAIIDLTTDLPTEVNLCDDEVIPALDASPTNQGIDLTQVMYEWTDEDGVVVSTNPIFTPATSGTYTVVVTLPPCSENTFTVVVDITEKPTLDLGADQVLCDGGAYEIVPMITGNTTGITYDWSTGETTPTIIADATGTYELTITVGNCTVSDSVDVFISDPIEASIGEDFETCPEEIQVLTVTTSAQDPTFQWFLNGDILTGETNATLEIELPAETMGTQIYSVVVTEGECTGEAEIGVTLYDVGNCTISQGISPNNDGFNDILDLTFLNDRTGITNLQIFNRLGTLVYEKTNYINEWQGQTTDNEELPTGTYFYVLDLAGDDSVYGTQASGWIYLNREAN